MIIVDGVDNTGKTTLAQELAEKYDLPLRKSTGPQKDNPEIVKEFIYSTLERDLQDEVIYDRHALITEKVYGPVLRGKNVLEEIEDSYYLLYMFKQTRPLIIYTVLPAEEIKATFEERDQLEGVYENVDELYRRFNKLAGQLRSAGFQVIKYNYKGDDKDKLMEVVEEYLLQGEVARIMRRYKNGQLNYSDIRGMTDGKH